MILKFTQSLTMSACAAVITTTAMAQDYPSETIRFVVGYPPGGSTDITARMIADHLSQNTEANFIVENRAGGSGVVGATSVANGTADGHTLLFAASPEIALVQALGRSVEYDPREDFEPVTMVGQVEFILAARGDFPADDLAGFLEYAQENPGTLSFASFGTGTSNHLVGEAFKAETGLDILHVPYNGSAPAMVDLLGGRVDIAFDTVPVVLPHLQNGGLKALGTATTERSELAPDVPTLNEQGLENFVGGTWFGLFAPSGVEADRIAWMNEKMGEAMNDPELRRALADRGVSLIHSTSEELSQHVDSEIDRWVEVVETSGVTVE